ncbi:MAG: radical SAM protein [Desulfobacterales bacterium]|nr:radical SAM protein [Desulfobacterales bacterium]
MSCQQIPSQVVLEVSGLCNLSCKGCIVHGPQKSVTRPMGNMQEDVWRSVIKEISTWDKTINLTTHGGGEPLFNPSLQNIITYAGQFPNIKPGFLTNGMLFTKEWAEFVVDSNMDWICFSIDGISPNTHASVRKNSDLLRIEDNLNTLIGLRKKKCRNTPRILLNMVSYDEVQDQVEPFLNTWLHQVDTIMVSHYRNPPQSKRWPRVPANRKPCFLLWSQMIIAWDGRLGLCCEDFNIDYCLGCVHDNSLLAMWNSGMIDELRHMHLQGQYDTHPMCQCCDTWADEVVQQEIIDQAKRYKTVYKASQIEFSSLTHCDNSHATC